LLHELTTNQQIVVTSPALEAIRFLSKLGALPV